MKHSNRCGSVVAIPARDEEDRIAACLDALDQQEGARFSDIVVLVNNSVDATARVARSLKMRSGARLHIINRDLPPDQANAGMARRLAMQAAARLAMPGGVLLTTDADGLVDPDWLKANLDAICAGADAVAGWCELHPLEWGEIPARLHEDDARECAYDALCDEIHSRLDPDLADPLPRHTQHSGASIAVTAEAFARCGGVPRVATGEDRALMAALRRIDATIRHAPEVHVTVSARIEGRAAGGMAETIRRRLSVSDSFLDDRLEPAKNCARRAMCRAVARSAYRHSRIAHSDLPALTGLSAPTLQILMAAPYFGMAWEAVEAASPLLRRTRVPVDGLGREMSAARAILDAMPGKPYLDDAGAAGDLIGEVL